MRFGHWRGVMFAVALFLSMAAGRMASADGWGHTMPKEILARDLATGQPYMAPPIPWGHYAKSGVGDHFFPKGGLLGKLHSGCLFCGKGGGKCGHGLYEGPRGTPGGDDRRQSTARRR